MKWGIRRYQNPDGTLTEAGKKRYSAEWDKKTSNISSQINAYNRASDKFNSEIGNINNKYKGKKLTTTPDLDFDTKEGQKYVREVRDTWKKLYSDELINEFGENELDKGRNWMHKMFQYDMYDTFVKDISK